MDVISIILFFLLLFAILSGIFVVKQQTAAIVESVLENFLASDNQGYT